MKKITLLLLSAVVAFSQNLPLPPATQAQAEAGTANNATMTPLRTKQAITALAGAGGSTAITYTVDAMSGTSFDVTKPWSSKSISGNVTWTPSAAGTANTVHVLRITNSGTVPYAVTVDNTGVDYTLAIPPGTSYRTLVGDGTDWVPTNSSWIEEIPFISPDVVDGTGCTIGTTSTTIGYGRASFSGSAAKTANYAVFWQPVPYDFDASTDLSLKLVYRLNAADTGKHSFEVSMADVTDSAGLDSPTFSNAVTLNFAGDASGASGDRESIAYTTLTGWKSALTPGHTLVIKIARVGDDATNDTSTQSTTLMTALLKIGHAQ